MGSESEKQAKLNKIKYFNDIQKGLKESFFHFNKTLDHINNWDELINLKEESIEEITIKRTKTIKEGYTCCKKFLFLQCGVFFVIIQLIGVQASIIILNSLFNEIVDEFKLWFNNTPREYSFYENLEINSYRELPEIDVGMITSSVGIIFLKNSGFICSNITFQLSSSIWFLLLFLLFDFHTGVQLLENYTRLEIVILVLSYVILSFLVGCSSTIALKEFNDKNFGIYYKKENKDTGEKILFYLFSIISAFIIMPINRKIITSYKDKTPKWILKWTAIICFISFSLSMVFYFFYLIPITTNKKIIKKNINYEIQDEKEKESKEIRTEKEDISKEILYKIKKENTNREIQSENEREDISKEILYKIKKEDTNREIQSENEKKDINKEIQSESEKEDISKENQTENERVDTSKEIQSESERKDTSKGNQTENERVDMSKEIKNRNEDKKSNNLDSECVIFKFNQSFPQNKEQIDIIRKQKFEKNMKKEIYSTKICTLCGYIYFRKKTAQKSTCICYYYTNKCTWFEEKIINKEVIIPFLIELYCQVCIMGFKEILIEKLLNEYSYTKNIKFYCALFIIILFFSIISIPIFSFFKKSEEKEKKNSEDVVCGYLAANFIHLLGYIIFTFISSICYYTENNYNRERWNNIVMAEFILFKIIDFRILSFYDFFDNSDIFNTTLAITFEKLLWMIIETIINTYVENKKSLVLVQIIATSIILGLIAIFLICTFCTKS